MAELPFETALYNEIKVQWPSTGKHILGAATNSSVILYQAYKPTIAEFAAKHQTFKGCPEFSLSRMTWLKPNFLWMMYRSGWATKPNQEHILAITVKREGFDEILTQASTQGNGDVRLQWDPDHGPNGENLPRRAIQLGIRSKILDTFLTEWILRIDDITTFVLQQGALVQNQNLEKLQVPKEAVIRVDRRIQHIVGADDFE